MIGVVLEWVVVFAAIALVAPAIIVLLIFVIPARLASTNSDIRAEATSAIWLSCTSSLLGFLIMLVLLGPFFAVLAAFFLWPVSLIAAFVGLSLNRAARHRLSKRQYRTALRCTAIILVGAVAVLAFRQYLEDNPIHPGPSCFQLALRCRMPRGAEILQFHQTEPFLDTSTFWIHYRVDRAEQRKLLEQGHFEICSFGDFPTDEPSWWLRTDQLANYNSYDGSIRTEDIDDDRYRFVWVSKTTMDVYACAYGEW